MDPPHPVHRRYYAEDLVRLRRAGEGLRYAASQRRGRIDPNPHQVEAVMFALGRIPMGGCILADEVGLGKTIEAGLVIAQLLSEGASRVLIVVPLSLLGQWQSELYTLFGIEAQEAADEGVDLSGPGVFLAGREYAGGVTGAERLGGSPPFDLCVIDEAHEVFAAIHRRFDRYGVYDEASRYARTADRVRKVIGRAPVLLLTATPIQNSLEELWGLVQYVEPTGTLLGSLPTFRSLFCADGDARRLVPEQSEELRRRLGSVVKRTLRRQAQEFLDKPFVGRRAQLFEYSMSPEERALYDGATEYLLRPNLCAFQGRSRQLLLLGFHRRMASSTAALAQSLEKVAERLRRMFENPEAGDATDAAVDLLDDLEDDGAIAEMDASEPTPSTTAGGEGSVPTPSRIRAELGLVEDLIQRARTLPHDSKAESLVKAVQLATQGKGGGRKVVIFTESLTTQEYLRNLLIEKAGLSDDEITLFRGTNTSPRAVQALSTWEQEVGSQIAPYAQPRPEIAMRLALVHEFKTRSKVLVSTEAGAKGLNLQFCDTIINCDLPWNPQRIEQRIGRCHRYGQTRDVTVINFLAKDNEAQRLTFEILSGKLDLFGEVLDMSDEVLHTPRSARSEELATVLGPDFEAQLRRIWDRARSIQEVEAELRDLSDVLEERRRETFDIEGHQTNFPIARGAARDRGLDYLAIGDTHAFRDVEPDARAPVVYPGAPEPTNFREKDTGHVALVFFPRDRSRRPIIDKAAVGVWTWREATCRSMAELRALRRDDNLRKTVLQLRVEMRVPVGEYDEAQRILTDLRGSLSANPRVGVLAVDRSDLRLAIDEDVDFGQDLPPVLESVVRRLKEKAAQDPDRAERALHNLYELMRGGA